MQHRRVELGHRGVRLHRLGPELVTGSGFESPTPTKQRLAPTLLTGVPLSDQVRGQEFVSRNQRNRFVQQAREVVADGDRKRVGQAAAADLVVEILGRHQQQRLGLPLHGRPGTRGGQGDSVVDVIAGQRAEELAGLLGRASDQDPSSRPAPGSHADLETVPGREFESFPEDFERKGKEKRACPV